MWDQSVDNTDESKDAYLTGEATWADKYWGLSDDRSRLSGHEDSKTALFGLRV
jgi:hypothetical protein